MVDRADDVVLGVAAAWRRAIPYCVQTKPKRNAIRNGTAPLRRDAEHELVGTVDHSMLAVSGRGCAFGNRVGSPCRVLDPACGRRGRLARRCDCAAILATTSTVAAPIRWPAGALCTPARWLWSLPRPPACLCCMLSSLVWSEPVLDGLRAEVLDRHTGGPL